MKKEKLKHTAAAALIMLLAFFVITVNILAQSEDDEEGYAGSKEETSSDEGFENEESSLPEETGTSYQEESEEETTDETGEENTDGTEEETTDEDGEETEAETEAKEETQGETQTQTPEETEPETEEQTHPETETEEETEEETKEEEETEEETETEEQTQEETEQESESEEETKEETSEEAETEAQTQEETQTETVQETQEETTQSETQAETNTQAETAQSSEDDAAEESAADEEDSLNSTQTQEAIYNELIIEEILTESPVYFDYSYTISKAGSDEQTEAEISPEIITYILSGEETDAEEITEELEEIIEDDGVYTLTVTYMDESGNEKNEEVSFTVNRYGSVYVYGEYLAFLIEDGGQYVRKIEEDLVITEYNPDLLVEGSLNVEITCDGSSLKEVSLLAVYAGYETDDEELYGWRKYKYTIGSENFTKDGVYKINISSSDEAGNNPENLNSDNGEIIFRVDSSAPEIVSITGLEEERVYAKSLEVSCIFFDAFALDRVQVYVDGILYEEEKIEEDINSASLSFTLYEKNKEQSIEIVAYDLAGNCISTADEDFNTAFEFKESVLVLQNPLRSVKAYVWITASIVCAALAAAGIFFMIRKKKRRSRKALK